jgi:hypothetical protein
MYTMNQLTIIGFTGNDAEAHYTQNGTRCDDLSRDKRVLEGRRRQLAEQNRLAPDCFF